MKKQQLAQQDSIVDEPESGEQESEFVANATDQTCSISEETSELEESYDSDEEEAEKELEETLQQQMNPSGEPSATASQADTKKVSKQSSVEYTMSEEVANAQLQWGDKLSVLGTGDNEAAQIVKLTNVSARHKRHIKARLEEERIKAKHERRRQEEKRQYWINQLNEYNKSIREYSEVYNDLYEYSRVSIENNLKPLKEYYFFNPHDFNPQDPSLMDKAIRFAERMQRKIEKFKENNTRDKNLARIFKEVKEQHSAIHKALREMKAGFQNIDSVPFENKKPKRQKNKHLKKIELGDKVIMIDAQTVENENNRAEK